MTKVKVSIIWKEIVNDNDPIFFGGLFVLEDVTYIYLFEEMASNVLSL